VALTANAASPVALGAIDRGVRRGVDHRDRRVGVERRRHLVGVGHVARRVAERDGPGRRARERAPELAAAAEDEERHARTIRAA
jgi:hypothetical protein